MGSIIEFQTWSGGEGWNDPRYLLGYCKETPQEVLKNVLLTHDVYHYKDLYRPIDNNFPNNVSGLIINEFNRKDLEIKGVLADMDISIAETRNKRTKETIVNSLDGCKKWHTYSNKELQAKYDILFNEVEDIIDKFD